MRRNAEIDLGPIDDKVALVLCDPSQHDMPIVHVSRGFTDMTGYTESEVRGMNCRFLQHRRSGWPKPDSMQSKMNVDANRQMRQSIRREEEVQVTIMNYRKDGSMFPNVVTIIPIVYEGRKYCVGFQHDYSSNYWTKR